MKELDLDVFVSAWGHFPRDLLDLLDRRPRRFDAMCKLWPDLPFEYQLEIVDRVLPVEPDKLECRDSRYLESQRMALAEVASTHRSEAIRFQVAVHHNDADWISEDRGGLIRAVQTYRFHQTAVEAGPLSLPEDFWELSHPERIVLSKVFRKETEKKLSELIPPSVEDMEVLRLYLSTLIPMRQPSQRMPSRLGAFQHVAATLEAAPSFVSEWVTANPFIDCRLSGDDLITILNRAPGERLKILKNGARCMRSVLPGIGLWVLADVLQVLDENGTGEEQRRLRRQFAGLNDSFSFADLYLWDQIWHSRKDRTVESLIDALRQLDAKRQSLQKSDYNDLLPNLIRNPRIRLLPDRKQQLRECFGSQLVFPKLQADSDPAPIDFTTRRLAPIRLDPPRDPPRVPPSLEKLISPAPLSFEQLLHCFPFLSRQLCQRIIRHCSEDPRFHPLHLAALEKAPQGPEKQPRASVRIKIGAERYLAYEPAEFWTRSGHAQLAVASAAHQDIDGFCRMLVASVRSSRPPDDEALARVVAEFLLSPEIEAEIAGSPGKYTEALLELAESLPAPLEVHFSSYAVFTFSIADDQLTRLLSLDEQQVVSKLGLIARLSRRIEPPEVWCFVGEATHNADFAKVPLGMDRTLHGRVGVWKRSWFRNMAMTEEAVAHFARCALCNQCLSAKGLLLYGDVEGKTWLRRCREAWQMFLERKPGFEEDPSLWPAMMNNYPVEGFRWMYGRFAANDESAPP